MTKCIVRTQRFVFETLESLFFRYGFWIASNPWKVILLSLCVVLSCAAGLFRFRQEKNPVNLWVPPQSDYRIDTEWILEKFKEGYRAQSVLVTAPNVLDPRILLQVEKIRKRIALVTSSDNKTFEDVCFRIPRIKHNSFNIWDALGRRKRSFFYFPDPADVTSLFDPSSLIGQGPYCKIVNNLPTTCLDINLPQLWENSENDINNLVLDDVISKLNSTSVSPVIGLPIAFKELLGSVERDGNGKIVSAESLLSIWMVHLNFSQVDFDAAGNDAGTGDWATVEILNWEKAFLDTMSEVTAEFAQKDANIKIYYEAGRSFGDISSKSMFQDMGKLFIGSVLMFFLVQLLLPTRYNFVELRFWPGCAGLLSIVLSFISTIGLCSLFGIFYGPVHTSLPFLLLGIGVDDMFVITSHWKALSQTEKDLPLEKQIAVTMSHSAVSVTITSVTNMVAFYVGAYTILPCLQSFCLYIGTGIIFLYLSQITIFPAVLTLDEIRIRHNRNALVPCFLHKAVPLIAKHSKESFGNKVITALFANFILKKPIKVAIILATIGFASAGIYGNLYLSQRFEHKWFLPSDSYLIKFIEETNRYYPESGMDGAVFIGTINYNQYLRQIHNLSLALESRKFIFKRFDSWTHSLLGYVKNNYDIDLLQQEITDEEFSKYLTAFLWSPNGALFQKNFRFADKLVCGKPAPKIEMSSLFFIFRRFSGPDEYIPAMNEVKALAKTSGIPEAVAWAKIYGNWVTDEVIHEELYRNLGMALACVMLCTFILIANIQVCFWIFFCVLLTLVDVSGMMYFWGLYIDIASCVALVLAVGLCVDFAAHISHRFLVTKPISSYYSDRSSRDQRVILTVNSIGIATLNAAFSTFISFALLGFSDAYIFQTFFKIFFLVIIFGMFHGVVFLPVVLSIWGPKEIVEELKTGKEQSDGELGKVETPLSLQDM